jgi:hypothetical protein
MALRAFLPPSPNRRDLYSNGHHPPRLQDVKLGGESRGVRVGRKTSLVSPLNSDQQGLGSATLSNILLDTWEDKEVCMGKFPMPVWHIHFTAALIEIGFKAAMAKRLTVEAKLCQKTLSIFVLRDVAG